jgi:thiol:disulfide interchange protein
MWCIIPLLAIIVGGFVALQTRNWQRAVLIGVIAGVVGGLFMTLLIATGVWGG